MIFNPSSQSTHRAIMKKLLLRLFIYIVILVSLPYGYFWFQAKSAISSFLLHQPLEGDFSYSRLSLDFDGNLYLKNASYWMGNQKVFSLEQIKIELTSIFDLLSAEEHILYQEYPPKITMAFIGGRSLEMDAFFKLFGVTLKEDYLHWIYPLSCQQQTKLKVKDFSFNSKVTFEIDNTANINSVQFSFDSLALFNLQGKFKINNFYEVNEDASFVSDLSLSFKDIAILQQNTQRCLTAAQLDQDALAKGIKARFEDLEKQHGLSVTEPALTALSNFIYIPDQVDLVFDLPEGKKYSQVDILPLESFQTNIGLSISLNKKNVGLVFEPEISKNKINPEKQVINPQKKHPFNPSPQLRPNKTSLSQYLGAKVSLELKNGKSVIGYIEYVGWKELEISQRKFKGKSLLPFKYEKIKSIKLLRLN